MPATGGLQGHTGVHHGQARAADRAHRRGAVGRQHVGHDADRVGELLLGGQHRHQGPLGEHAVADLAALRAAHEARLAGRERREVVVVHVALAVDDAERVEHLLHAGHAQRGDVQHLGLAPLEQAGAVHARGARPTSADSGRMSVGRRDRRCGRPRSTMRERTTALVSERNAALICFVGVGDLGEAADQLGHDGGAGLGLGLERARSCRRSTRRPRPGRARPRPTARTPRGCSRRRTEYSMGGLTPASSASSRCISDRVADPGLGGLEPVGDDLLGRPWGRRPRRRARPLRCRRPRPS